MFLHDSFCVPLLQSGRNIAKQTVVFHAPILQIKSERVQKEASETQYWIELLMEAGIGARDSAQDLHKEASELLAIFTAIGKKLKQ